MTTVQRVAPTSPDSPALEFDGIGMTFPDGTHAVDEVSFSVARGEFVTVVGPSGCGKSTLLKIAAGLLDADAWHGRSSTVSGSGTCSRIRR